MCFNISVLLKFMEKVSFFNKTKKAEAEASAFLNAALRLHLIRLCLWQSHLPLKGKAFFIC